jgi:hypothetical protein
MAVVQISKFKVRRGQELQTGMPQLDSGEFGWAEDTEHLYIGKRISDGAVDNNNTRILTEGDLDNIFSLIGNTVTDAIMYQYRDEIVNLTHTRPRPLKSKLNDMVSLGDFGVTTSSTATDITNQLSGAIQDLFFNLTAESPERADTRRQLRIPAGQYIVSQTIDLPPYTDIVGEGQGLSTLIMADGTKSLFRTVDAQGNGYSTNAMQSGSEAAQMVSISNLTLEYSVGTFNSPALLSLDNVNHAHISNCTFRTQIGLITTATMGWGTGIAIQGTGGGLGSGDINLCQNILIENCQFIQLNTGIHGTGAVIHPVIRDSLFNDLNQGIIFETLNALPGPSNGLITDNRFQDIALHGISVGANPSNQPTDHASVNNFFTQVGNGPNLDDRTYTTQTSIISFASSGNRSENDYFTRVQFGSTSTDYQFYYNAPIQGKVAVDGSPVVTMTVPQSTTTNLINLPLTGTDQMMSVRYQLYNSSLSRKGELIVNISQDGYASITDTYDYSETLYVVMSGIPPNTGSGINLLNVDMTLNPVFNTVDVSNNVWYVTGSTAYQGKAAALIANPSSGQYITDSNNPAFDFSTPGETYTLLNSDSPSVAFDVNTMNTATNNYVTLICQNSSQYIDSTIEFQINTIS